jgi:hydroxypyruvate isomerase
VNRRNFIATAAAVGTLSGAASRADDEAEDDGAKGGAEKPRPFTLRYGPHFGMFQRSAGKDLVDQLKFAADEGFTGWEDNTMKSRPVADQERVARGMEQLGMQMGVISALRGVWNRVSFGSGDREVQEKVLRALRDTVDVARRVNTKLLTVVPGMSDPGIPIDYQTAACVELLKRCCEVLAPHELVMVLEPLNHRDHAGVFLIGATRAFQLCESVDHPSCKILFDIYHQQVAEGNLLANIDRCWSQIGYFQSADNPSRCEPGTGEINYANIFRHLHAKGYRGVIGMEHRNSRRGRAGERAVIEAYRQVDPS